jgi:hypothetical protein
MTDGDDAGDARHGDHGEQKGETAKGQLPD